MRSEFQKNSFWKEGRSLFVFGCYSFNHSQNTPLSCLNLDKVAVREGMELDCGGAPRRGMIEGGFAAKGKARV